MFLLSSVGSLLVLSTLILLFAVVETILPVMAKHRIVAALNVAEVFTYSVYSGAGPCDTC